MSSPMLIYFVSLGIACVSSARFFLFYKQHLYKQRQAEIGKKSVGMNFCYLKIIFFIHVIFQK